MWFGFGEKTPQNKKEKSNLGITKTTWVSHNWTRTGLTSKRGHPVYGSPFRWKVRGAANWGWVWERRIDEFCRAHGLEWKEAAGDRNLWQSLGWYFVDHFRLPAHELTAADGPSYHESHLPTFWNGEDLSHCEIRTNPLFLER